MFIVFPLNINIDSLNIELIVFPLNINIDSLNRELIAFSLNINIDSLNTAHYISRTVYFRHVCLICQVKTTVSYNEGKQTG